MDKMTFRNKLNSSNPCKIVGAYDAVGCSLIEQAGFDAIWASGLCISAAHGVPDANIMSSDGLLSNLKMMIRSTKLPVIADCDTGYGDFHKVIHLVEELHNLGVQGMCFEDKVFPKINSFWDSSEHTLEKPEVFAAKIRAAVEYKKSEDFTVIARTEALIAGMDMEEALYRAEMYHYAGADAILIHSKKTDPSEVLEFVQRWGNRLPVIIVPTKYPSLTISEIKRQKIAGVIYANQVLRAAIRAVQDYLAQLMAAESVKECAFPIASIEEIFALQGMGQYKADEEKFTDFEANVLAQFKKGIPNQKRAANL